MKEPKRLFESGTPLERSILGFGRDEAPSAELARKTLAAMAAAPSASAGPHATSSPSPSWMRPRWIVAGACALGLAAAVAVVAQHDEGPSLAEPPAAPAAPTKAPVVENAPPPPTENAPPPPTENASEDELVVTPDSLPTAPARAAASQPSSNAPRAAAPASSASIAREVELLDIVKAKLGAGDSAAAARALDAYDGEFPNGTLRPEATVLRIRTLLTRGDRRAAEKLGSDFLAKHPSGVHAKRVRMLLAEPASSSAQ